MDFDLIYGFALSPAGNGIREWEKWKSPTSRLPHSVPQLQTTGESNLLAFMLHAQDGCTVSRYVFESVKLLWIVDENADLWLAVEEACNSVDRRLTIPILVKNPDGSKGWQKLGHPSLLAPPYLGRIAGELILRCPSDSPGFWELNNSSGRYGLNCGRTQAQLNAAAERFRAAGLRMDIDFQGV